MDKETYFEKAKEYFLVGRNIDAINCLNEAIKLDSNFGKAYSLRGKAFSRNKNFEQALEDANTGVALLPDSADVYCDLGYVLGILENHQEAVQNFNKSLVLGRNDAFIFYCRGISYINLDNLDEALVDFNDAIERNSNFASAYEGRGHVYYKKNEFEKALNDYNKAIDFGLNSYSLYLQRAITLSLLNKFEEAIPDYKKAIEINPQGIDAYINLSRCYWEVDVYNIEESKAICFKGIEVDGNNALIRYHLGKCFLEENDYPKAIVHLRKAIDLDKMNALYYESLGFANSQMGNYSEAKPYIDRALELDPKRAHAYYIRGGFYNNTGYLDESIDDYDKAISLDPNNEKFYVSRIHFYRFSEEKQDNQKAFENLVILEEILDEKKVTYKRGMEFMEIFNSIHAPFFLNRIIKQLDYIDTYISYQKLITQNLKECSDLIATLNFVKSNGVVEANKFQLLKGVITHYMKDPSACYKIFSGLIEKGMANNLMTQYYFVISSDQYLRCDHNTILDNAVAKANEFKSDKNIENNYLQLYYAGHIFYLKEKFQLALEYFEQINDFIPALCMQITCYNALNDFPQRDLLIQELLFLDRHNKGFLQLSFIPELSIDNFEETVLLYAHKRETESIIEIIIDYLEMPKHRDDQLKKLYEKIVSDQVEIFKVNTKTTEVINLWKKDITDDFCLKCEGYFQKNHKDYFDIWSKETDQDKLEKMLGSHIPILNNQKGGESKIVDLIDYFHIKKKISSNARSLLIFWSELHKFGNRKLTSKEQDMLKLTLASLFKLTLGYIGIPDLVIPIINIVGETLVTDQFTVKAVNYIEDHFIKTNNAIPEFYSDFKKQTY